MKKKKYVRLCVLYQQRLHQLQMALHNTKWLALDAARRGVRPNIEALILQDEKDGASLLAEIQKLEKRRIQSETV